MPGLAGGFADAPVEAARVFRAALDAMARPGSLHAVAGVTPPAPLSPAAAALALTLVDRDTPLWLAPPLHDPGLLRWLAFHTGAPVVADRGTAMFAFGRWPDLLPLDDYPPGEPAYPDRSATLVAEVGALDEDGPLRLTGPGIARERQLGLGLGPATAEIARALAGNARRFPLGLDVFFTCGQRLAAIPRSTQVDV